LFLECGEELQQAPAIQKHDSDLGGYNHSKVEVTIMHWAEVRELFPDTFVLLEEIKSQVRNRELYVEEVAVIRALVDQQEAMRELLKAKGEVFVYHTRRRTWVPRVRHEIIRRKTDKSTQSLKNIS
jgi:hypothetical protein